MKTRGQTYSQEAASLLRDISMYKALREGQLLRLYPKSLQIKSQGKICRKMKKDEVIEKGTTKRPPPKRRPKRKYAARLKGIGQVRA